MNYSSNMEIYENETVSIAFEGPTIFIKHTAYWISADVDQCSDFRVINNRTIIGHPTIAVNDRGLAKFHFSRNGQFILVYKYGNLAPYIPYYQYSVVVLRSQK